MTGFWNNQAAINGKYCPPIEMHRMTHTHCKGNKVPLIASLIVTSWMLSVCSPAIAYVGPGPGITLLGSLVGVASFLAVAIGGLLAWPIRQLRQKTKRGRREFDEKDAPHKTPKD
ncbi:hypothetical protein [Methylomonas methanica]|nr:hypothetical protein [Methylomonas methanica]